MSRRTARAALRGAKYAFCSAPSVLGLIEGRSARSDRSLTAGLTPSCAASVVLRQRAQPLAVSHHRVSRPAPFPTVSRKQHPPPRSRRVSSAVRL